MIPYLDVGEFLSKKRANAKYILRVVAAAGRSPKPERFYKKALKRL